MVRDTHINFLRWLFILVGKIFPPMQEHVMVSCNVLSCWSQLVSVLFFCGMLNFLSSDLQIQISKNGLHLKLKLHPLWRTTL